MVNENRRWWSCPHCGAIIDGDDGSECWNCSYVLRARRNVPWCTMGKKKCNKCSITYVTWVSPFEPEITLGFCPKHFQEDHYGERAYTPPMLPGYYVLVANGYRYDEARKKVVKVRAPRAKENRL